MKMRGTIVIFVVGLTYATASLLPSSVFNGLQRVNSRVQVKPTTCNNQPIGPCTDTFFAHFGLKNEYNESVFEAALDNYLGQHGVAGIADIRTWMQTLYTCVGGVDNLNACFQWDQLMAHYNMTKDMSLKWETIFLQLEYETGAGYDVFVRSFYCIVNVAAHEGPVIQTCKDRFNQQQNQNPNAVCQHLAEYLYCIDRPYTEHCGREAGGFMCQLERIGYLVYFPDCANQVALHCRGAPGQ